MTFVPGEAFRKAVAKVDAKHGFKTEMRECPECGEWQYKLTILDEDTGEETEVWRPDRKLWYHFGEEGERFFGNSECKEQA